MLFNYKKIQAEENQGLDLKVILRLIIFFIGNFDPYRTKMINKFWLIPSKFSQKDFKSNLFFVLIELSERPDRSKSPKFPWSQCIIFCTEISRPIHKWLTFWLIAVVNMKWNNLFLIIPYSFCCHFNWALTI